MSAADNTQGFADALAQAALRTDLEGPIARPLAASTESEAEIAANLESAPTMAAQQSLRAACAAPFLRRLIVRETAWLARLWARSAEDAADGLLRVLDDAAADASSQDWMTALRVARRRLALLTALADLGGVWRLEDVTSALSRFAERACDLTLRRLLAAEAQRGKLVSLEPDASGMFALAMGKLGARELNYSSDIDLILLYDQDKLAVSDQLEAKDRFPRIAREFVKILSTVNAEGYVARVDLRLRPDPAATPACMSTDAAERYYAALGRTWERAAHIKARPIAGDLAAGEAYLHRLEPFVWRRHLDFAAIEDAADMLARIRDHRGGAEIVFAGQDVKLGAGGIREIEFLAQTEQMILGGRARELRVPGTLSALKALQRFGRLPQRQVASLSRSYVHLRRLEHRLQMVEDQQTHQVPTDLAAQTRLAALMGAPDAAEVERVTLAHMTAARAAAQSLDVVPTAEETAAAREASDAAALFPDPERAAALAERWLDGAPRALRAQRAQTRMRRLAPEILRRLAAAGEPMRALAEFDRFLNGLPSGVQLLALFEATPWLLDLVTQICAAAPRLSATLARRPALFDAVLDVGFFAPPAPAAALAEELSTVLNRAEDYERRLDAARRWAAERRFQIGVGLLRAELTFDQARAGYSDVAEAAISALWPHVMGEIARQYGAPPGAGAAALALGKLGSAEMSGGSDIDLILIYDAPPDAVSDGPRSLPAPQYYARFTQTLINAISAPTAEGRLYEIDMRLRPSGNAGPVATSLTAFERYQRQDAWVWEHMALTRARPIAGAEAVRTATAAAIADALSRPREAQTVQAAALEMRRKLDAAHPKALKRPWALKYARGGLVDLEFMAQVGVLIAGGAGDGGLSPEAAFERLGADHALPRARRLSQAYRLQSALQQIERVALETPFDPESAPLSVAGLFVQAARRLSGDTPEQASRPVAPADFDALQTALMDAQAAAAAAFETLIGQPHQGSD